jgi:hypothetical protein
MKNEYMHGITLSLVILRDKLDRHIEEISEINEIMVCKSVIENINYSLKEIGKIQDD